jgi:hypothetical protein
MISTEIKKLVVLDNGGQQKDEFSQGPNRVFQEEGMVLLDKDGHHGAQGRRSPEQTQEFEGIRASNPVPICRRHRDVVVTINGRKSGGLFGKVAAAR